tara:strand:+ start:708 stop:1403 length:696 start_codon:yes stop_codon:yes gene_type:complete
MELTKEQIKFIDHRLENEGIKYWDIRIEMLDHVVSDVEQNLKPENSAYEFKEIVQQSFENLGWKENFNGGGFDHINKEGWKYVGKQYRKLYFQGFLDFFKDYKKLSLFIIGFFLLYTLTESVSKRAFYIINTIIFSLPVLFSFFQYYKVFRKKLGKSIHRDYGLHYMVSSFFIFNMFFQLMKNDDFLTIPVEYHNIILLIIVPLHIVFSISGYQVYKKAIVKTEKIKQHLL